MMVTWKRSSDGVDQLTSLQPAVAAEDAVTVTGTVPTQALNKMKHWQGKGLKHK